MKGWKIAPGIVVLLASMLLVGSVFGQEEPEEDDGGLFDLFPGMDPEDMEMVLELDFKDVDNAELIMTMEMDMGEYASFFRGMIDAAGDGDGEVEEEEITGLEGLFEEDEMEDGFLGLEILVDNKTAQKEFDSGWTGLLGDVNSTEPIGMYASIEYTWTIEESDIHTIILRSMESEEEWEDENYTIEYETENNETGSDFSMTFRISFPDGWTVDIDSVVPLFMADFVTEDGNSIELTAEDIENMEEPEGDIVSFDLIKGDPEDSPLPLWIPVSALLIGTISVGLLRRRRH